MSRRTSTAGLDQAEAAARGVVGQPGAHALVLIAADRAAAAGIEQAVGRYGQFVAAHDGAEPRASRQDGFRIVLKRQIGRNLCLGAQEGERIVAAHGGGLGPDGQPPAGRRIQRVVGPVQIGAGPAGQDRQIALGVYRQLGDGVEAVFIVFAGVEADAVADVRGLADALLQVGGEGDGRPDIGVGVFVQEGGRELQRLARMPPVRQAQAGAEPAVDIGRARLPDQGVGASEPVVPGPEQVEARALRRSRRWRRPRECRRGRSVRVTTMGRLPLARL